MVARRRQDFSPDRMPCMGRGLQQYLAAPRRGKVPKVLFTLQLKNRDRLGLGAIRRPKRRFKIKNVVEIIKRVGRRFVQDTMSDHRVDNAAEISGAVHTPMGQYGRSQMSVAFDGVRLEPMRQLLAADMARILIQRFVIRVDVHDGVRQAALDKFKGGGRKFRLCRRLAG